MAERKQKRPPRLNLPPDEDKSKIVVQEGSVRNIDEPLKLKYVDKDDKDIGALVLNVILGAIIFAVLRFVIARKTGNPFLTIGFPLCVVWIVAVYKRHQMWVEVPAQQVYIYLDSIFSENIIVYTQGGHFTALTSKKQGDEINFQKHEVISANKAANNEIVFPTKNGIDATADITILFRRKEGEEALSRSLRYQTSELLGVLIKAKVKARLSDLGGQNSIETILWYKVEVKNWIAGLFSGEGNSSPFEIGTGTDILNPIVDNIDMTEESKRIFSTKARIKMIADGIKTLTGKETLDLSSEEASIVAQVAENVATRVVYTYQGIPKDAKYVSLGSDGMAIAPGGKGKNK